MSRSGLTQQSPRMPPDMYAWDSEEVPHMQNSKSAIIYNDEARLLCRYDRMNPHCSLGSLLKQLASGVFKVEPEVIRLFSSNVIKNISNYNELVT